ncbi:MAG TPA: hypothetical protein VGK19_10310 [Capsulimonadaceae bacterium]|jgi:hypothetical protein
MEFPIVDPIPVPAPIWLMKVLGLLTLALHFVSVQILIGSLLAVWILSLKATSTQSLTYKTAAHVLARRITIVMTFVINLGIPPLLFAQVLYGRALYTSSVLIGVIWIGVVFILMLDYWVMYQIVYRTGAGKPASLMTFIALVLSAGVGRILSMNMTLMLKPEVWKGMYAQSALGFHLPPPDPTAIPRWLFIITGAILTTGLWTLLHSSIVTIDDDVKALLRKLGGHLSVIGAVIVAVVGYFVYSTQPAVVQAGLTDSLYFKVSAAVWCGGVVLAAVLALSQSVRKAINVPVTLVACLMGFLSLCGAVCCRDGIRDITLSNVGFDVWNRTVVPNWGVLGIFFLLFVITLVVVAWLLLVMKQAKPVSEQVTQ